MLLVILILSVILPAIRPLEHPSPIHLVVQEVAVKLSIVRPSVVALSMQVVVAKFALKNGAVLPPEFSLAVFHPVLEVTDV